LYGNLLFLDEYKVRKKDNCRERNPLTVNKAEEIMQQKKKENSLRASTSSTDRSTATHCRVGAARLLHLFRGARIGRAARPRPTARRGDTGAQPIPARFGCLPASSAPPPHSLASFSPIPALPSVPRTHART